MSEQIENLVTEEAMQQVKDLQQILEKCVYYANILKEKHGLVFAPIVVEIDSPPPGKWPSNLSTDKDKRQ